jgi:tetratricopeptide (TPR) repeat protein
MSSGLCLRNIFKYLGSCSKSMKDYQQAEEYFEASLTLARSINKRNEEMEILHRFGKTYVEPGDIDQSIHSFNEGIDLAKTSRNSKFKGIFLARIGDTYAQTPQKQKAINFICRLWIL